MNQSMSDDAHPKANCLDMEVFGLTPNMILTPKHTNLVGLVVETNLSLVWMLRWEISIKQQQQMSLKRLKILNNQPKIGRNKTRLVDLEL